MINWIFGDASAVKIICDLVCLHIELCTSACMHAHMLAHADSIAEKNCRILQNSYGADEMMSFYFFNYSQFT